MSNVNAFGPYLLRTSISALSFSAHLFCKKSLGQCAFFIRLVRIFRDLRVIHAQLEQDLALNLSTRFQIVTANSRIGCFNMWKGLTFQRVGQTLYLIAVALQFAMRFSSDQMRLIPKSMKEYYYESFNTIKKITVSALL